MPWVRADKLETDVVRQLFLTFGNPAAIERAVKRAIPDCEKAMKQRKQVEAQLAKIVRARDRVLALIEKDLITDAEAEKKLHELKGRESALRIDLERLPAVLADLPDKKRLQIHVERDGKFIFVFDDDGNTRPGGNDIGTFLLMTDADRRNLIDAGLSGSGADGKPAGVYLTPAGGDRHAPKRFNYVVRGRLLERVEPRALP
ncbi:MAG: hypothetical protein EXR98_22395 [Gemmataceae bacterium]|nr:hypothetical protein [Gemmataceae bacterium]